MRCLGAIGVVLVCLPAIGTAQQVPGPQPVPAGQQIRAAQQIPPAQQIPAAQQIPPAQQLPAVKQPAPAKPAPPNDPMIDEACSAVDSGDYSALLADTTSQLRPELDDLKHLDAPLIIRLAAFRTFAQYFARLNAPAAPTCATLKWLVHQPQLFPTLMLALSDSDPPDGLAKVLTDLRLDDASALDHFVDLTTSLCVVRDKDGLDADAGTPLDTTRAIHLLHYYINMSDALPLNPRTMPWQLLNYVVDSKASDEDILWALHRYGAARNVAACYFDVPYDQAAFYSGDPKQIAAHAYTLENLTRFGGVCTDQAYFAAQVSKTLGVPACVCTGESGAGEPAHAWVGALTVSDGVPYWDFQTGRYADFLFWSGTVVDPQTLEEISEGDVGLLAELRRSTPVQRAESLALLKSLDLVDDDQKFDFLTTAINLSPANRGAWLALADWCGAAQFDLNKANKVADVVQKFALRHYPEFAFGLLMRMTRNQPADRQAELLDRIAGLFGDRPDLLSRIRIAQGDVFKEAAEDQRALAAYGEVLQYRESDAGPAVVQAMARVDQMLRNDNDLQRLAEIYRYVWTRLPRPEPSAYARGTPYCIIGQHYAELLDDLYATSEALQVRAAIDGLQINVR